MKHYSLLWPPPSSTQYMLAQLLYLCKEMGLLLTFAFPFLFVELVILQKGKFVSSKYKTNLNNKDMTTKRIPGNRAFLGLRHFLMKGVPCLQLHWNHQCLPWTVIQGPRKSCPLHMKIFSFGLSRSPFKDLNSDERDAGHSTLLFLCSQVLSSQ